MYEYLEEARRENYDALMSACRNLRFGAPISVACSLTLWSIRFPPKVPTKRCARLMSARWMDGVTQRENIYRTVRRCSLLRSSQLWRDKLSIIIFTKPKAMIIATNREKSIENNSMASQSLNSPTLALSLLHLLQSNPIHIYTSPHP